MYNVIKMCIIIIVCGSLHAGFQHNTSMKKNIHVRFIQKATNMSVSLPGSRSQEAWETWQVGRRAQVQLSQWNMYPQHTSFETSQGDGGHTKPVEWGCTEVCVVWACGASITRSKNITMLNNIIPSNFLHKIVKDTPRSKVIIHSYVTGLSGKCLWLGPYLEKKFLQWSTAIHFLHVHPQPFSL